jgi:hypothetical protein
VTHQYGDKTLYFLQRKLSDFEEIDFLQVIGILEKEVITVMNRRASAQVKPFHSERGRLMLIILRKYSLTSN